MHNYLVLPFVLIAAITYADSDVWFEGQWISDQHLTAEANPAIKTFDEDLRRKFIGMFGKLRWVVEDGTLIASHPESPDYRSSYTINEVDEGRFEVSIFLYTDTVQVLTIWKVEGGFCMKPGSSREISNARYEGIIECFRKDDA